MSVLPSVVLKRNNRAFKLFAVLSVNDSVLGCAAACTQQHMQLCLKQAETNESNAKNKGNTTHETGKHFKMMGFFLATFVGVNDQ